MKSSIERIILLMQHSRYSDAATQIQQSMLEHPEDSLLHLLMAECQSELKQLDKAQEYAEQAIRFAPDSDDAYRVMATILVEQKKTKKALEFAETAVRLNPDEATNHAGLASVYLQLSKWQAALESADKGLQMEPDHNRCLNIRAIALTKLGRKQDVDDTIKVALRDNPEDALTHANWGWALLHESKPHQALNHFKEALRLDPELEWARVGVVEAIKSKNVIYGLMLRFYLGLSRFPAHIQMILIVGIFFGEKVIRKIVSSIPAIAPAADWILVGYVLFVFMAWMSISFFNLMLRLHPEGKLALSDKQKSAANWFGLGLLGCIGLAAFMFYRFGAPPTVAHYILPFLIMFPITVTIKARMQVPKLTMVTYTLVVILFFTIGIIFKKMSTINISLVLAIASTWIGAFIPKEEEMV